MHRIKLLHITSSLKIGGAEKLLCDLIKHMSSKFEHHVIFFHDGPHRTTLQSLNIPMHHIKGVVSLYDPIFMMRLYQCVKKINPDIIHTQLWAANNAGRVIGKMLGKPVICALHNYLDHDGAVRNFIDRRTVNMADQFIAFTDEIAESLTIREKNKNLSITVLPIGIDIKQLHEDAMQTKVTRSSLNLSDEHFIVGSVGRFVPVRRHDLMIYAFYQVQKKLSHARLILVGVGELEEKLRKKVSQLNIQDKVIFIIGEPSYRYYHLFDCFILTSDKEGPSLALLEAMSFGIPCVRTNITMNHPVIEHKKNGLLTIAGDVTQLALAIIRVAENPVFAKMLAVNAQQTVESKFLIQESVKQFEKICFNAIKG